MHPVWPVHQRVSYGRSSWKKSDTDAVWKALADPELHVVVQTAPSIRAAIGEGFGLEPGTPAHGEDGYGPAPPGLRRRLRYGLRPPTSRLSKKLTSFLPVSTTAAAAHDHVLFAGVWVSFMEKFYPALMPHASTCKSPMSMLSTLANNLLRREGRNRSLQGLCRCGHALCGQEVRGEPQGTRHGRRHSLHRRRPHHARVRSG